MTTVYVSWYYGYKNFGDELLLLWVIEFFLSKVNLWVSNIIIESAAPKFLAEYLIDYKKTVGLFCVDKNIESIREKIYISNVDKFLTNDDSLSKKRKKACEKQAILISCVSRSRIVWRKLWINNIQKKNVVDYIVLWWWEGLTDSRSFPHNGRSALFRFLPFFINRKVIAIWWFGSPNNRFSKKILYPIYIWRLHHAYTRESSSYTVVKQFIKNKDSEPILYQDFSLDILRRYMQTKSSQDYKEKSLSKTDHAYGILNINAHIRSLQSIEKMRVYLWEHSNVHLRFFVPASGGWDDSDETYGLLLQKEFPDVNIVIWHRTEVSLYETLDLLAEAKVAMIARLHLVLPLHLFGVQYTPLVYQPKIIHMIKELEKIQL